MSFQIRLQNFQITDFDFKVESDEKDTTNDINTIFSYSFAKAEESESLFAIIFNLVLENESKNFFLKVKSVAHFEANSPLEEFFENSSFAKISAPAIAFPYLRVFISNFTLNAGYDPIILPSFNFVKLSEENNGTSEIKSST